MKFACHIQFDSDDLNEAIAIIDTLLASEEGQKLTKPGQPVRTEIQQLKIESVNHLRKDEAFDGQYVIKSVLGISASGIVYKAACLISERVVAIKVLHRDCAADPFLIAQLSSEPRGASAPRHPHIVTANDFAGLRTGQPYLVMDYISGQPLTRLIGHGQAIDWSQLTSICIQICDGLAAIHSQGLTHCNLKPSNIILQNADQGKHFVKILDTGLGRSMRQGASSKLRLTDSFTGNPLYISPEQCSGGALDARSDIYSLGCIMYEALSGRPVFDGVTPHQLFLQHSSERPKPISFAKTDKTVSKGLEPVIFKALEKLPAERYASVSDLKEDLLACLDRN